MSGLDPRTARLLADRMVDSFFDGLSDSELGSILTGSGEDDAFSPLFSMLTYTYEVYLEQVNLPEDEVRDFFKCAVQRKLKEFADRPARS